MATSASTLARNGVGVWEAKNWRERERERENMCLEAGVDA